jgi:hypothetical protein
MCTPIAKLRQSPEARIYMKKKQILDGDVCWSTPHPCNLYALREFSGCDRSADKPPE